ncbi:MAG: FAD-binding protein [Lapillicoccus sp.]
MNAQSSATETVVRNHLQAFLKQEGVDSIVQDYDDAAQFLTESKIYHGKHEIHGFFVDFLDGLPAGAISRFELRSLQVEGSTGYITWRVGDEIPLGTDTFVVEHGKIVSQTFAMFAPPSPQVDGAGSPAYGDDRRDEQARDATLVEFAGGLRGSAVLPSDPGYDQARSIWNGAHDRHPEVIAQCAGVADVVRTVALARSEGVPLAVRGGGHSIPGFSTVDGGILLDLSRMTGIEVHPEDRTVTAQAGCTWKDLDAETQQFGLAVTGGLVSSTGIAGFTTGGGIGWLMRKHGLACDNLIGADVVTADGRFVHASATENAELFWGLRGGGGNFGVVTSFDYQLHEVGPTVLSGLVFYPADEIDQVLAGYRAACAGAPDELTTLINLTTAPPVPFLPESVHGTPVIGVGGCWSGDPDLGEAATAPFRTLGTVIADVFAANPYTGWQQALDPLYPRGLHNYFRSAFLPALDDRALRVLTESFATLPNPLAEIHVQHLGGAVGRVHPQDTAYALRDQEFIVNVIARTPDATGFEQVVDWARGVTTELGPDASTYVNFTGDADPALVRASYPPETYRRLVELKNRYDPTNLFHLNQNITPTAVTQTHKTHHAVPE